MTKPEDSEIDWDTLAPGKDCETPEEWADYERWFRAKVERSRADPRPGIPHEVVMAEIRRKLETNKPKR